MLFDPANWDFAVNHILQQGIGRETPVESISKKTDKISLFSLQLKSSKPEYKHSESLHVNRSNIIPKANSFIEGNSKEQSKSGSVDRFIQKVSSKMPLLKGLQASKEPTTDLVVPFADIGRIVFITPETGQLIEISPASNIDAAIAAFKGEDNPTQNHKQKLKAKKNFDDHCGISGYVDDLAYIRKLDI